AIDQRPGHHSESRIELRAEWAARNPKSGFRIHYLALSRLQLDCGCSHGLPHERHLSWPSEDGRECLRMKSSACGGTRRLSAMPAISSASLHADASSLNSPSSARCSVCSCSAISSANLRTGGKRDIPARFRGRG